MAVSTYEFPDGRVAVFEGNNKAIVFEKDDSRKDYEIRGNEFYQGNEKVAGEAAAVIQGIIGRKNIR